MTRPIIIPPILPIRTAAQILFETSRELIKKYEVTINKTAEPIVPILNADSGDLFEESLTNMIPMIEQTRPSDARASGRNISSLLLPPSISKAIAERVEAIAIVAIIDPQYDSKMSEPIPAISPTLSPTLSAITAGLRGSSSGIPASIFPTRSAPTSALFVKMPPPTREKRATTEPPIAKPWRASECSAPKK